MYTTDESLKSSRLEEELTSLLKMHSRPLDPKKAQEVLVSRPLIAEAGIEGGGLIRIPLVPEHVVPSLNDIIRKLINLGKGESVRSVFRKERKRVVDQTMSQLGLNSMTPEELVKQPWDSLENQIDIWLQCIGVGIRVVFASEKNLCELAIFEPELAGECFMEAALSSMESIFSFSEAIASGRRSPEKLFRVLEMYEAFRDLRKCFDSLFLGDKCKPLQTEYNMSLLRLSEASRGIFAEFEYAIERDSTRTAMPGGAVHGLTRYVVNYLILLHDYRVTLSQLYTSPVGTSMTEASALATKADSEDDIDEEERKQSDNSPLAATNRWKVSVLHRNLEAKAKLYKDPALGHLFMMNNLHYITSKVKNSDLRTLYGDDWIRQQAELVRKHANSYHKHTWAKLLACLREDPTPGKEPGSISRTALKERFKQCNVLLEEIHAVQSQWAVPEAPLKDELVASIIERVLGSYRIFHSRYARVLEAGKHPAKYIKYSPSNVEAMIQDLFKGPKM